MIDSCCHGSWSQCHPLDMIVMNKQRTRVSCWRQAINMRGRSKAATPFPRDALNLLPRKASNNTKEIHVLVNNTSHKHEQQKWYITAITPTAKKASWGHNKRKRIPWNDGPLEVSLISPWLEMGRAQFLKFVYILIFVNISWFACSKHYVLSCCLLWKARWCWVEVSPDLKFCKMELKKKKESAWERERKKDRTEGRGKEEKEENYKVPLWVLWVRHCTH